MPLDVLVLDAAPLLALAPLHNLAKSYVTTPQVLAELRDPHAREHFEKLRSEGITVEVRSPDVVAYSKVSAAAKRSGDFVVLSQTDMLLIALTLNLHDQQASAKSSQSPLDESAPEDNANDFDISSSENESEEHVVRHSTDEAKESVLNLKEMLLSGIPQPDSRVRSPSTNHKSSPRPVFEDPQSEDDGEGEWITPDNVGKFKARELFENPTESGKTAPNEPIGVACMTADYAMQNVLLHLGLNLVGLEGKRITTVKTWILRCHACYKICKDQTKKFCPSCGNPTLLRASVSTKVSPLGSAGPPTVQVHLKNNFQYRNRGSKYSIPAPKAGNAKGTNNIILREDQVEFQRGLKSEAVRARKEEKRIASAFAASAEGKQGGKSWADPDWMPDMMLGKSSRRGSALPDIGFGRRNPNEVRKKKR